MSAKTYLGEFPVDIANSPFKDWDRSKWALHFIERYGGIDGDHHKTWVIDQVARILCGSPVKVVEARWTDHDPEYRFSVNPGPGYHAWVKSMKHGEDGPDTYEWDEGKSPRSKKWDEGIAP